MCYSAQIWANYRKYLRIFGAVLSIRELRARRSALLDLLGQLLRGIFFTQVVGTKPDRPS